MGDIRPDAGAKHDPLDPSAFHTGPGPSKRAFLLAWLGVVVGGIFGALIGFGLVRTGCHGRCAMPEASGSVIGAVLAALGTGVVAVLALRAMAEWRRPRPGGRPPRFPGS